MKTKTKAMTTEFSELDSAFMSEAIRLAWKGLYSTDPNPRVGCVLVKDDEVIGRGFHVRAGEEHAEVNALREAGDRAQGSTAYVTLEPCSHYGKTPPCSEALIKAGVSEVVAAMTDPNPEVAGNGLKMLKDAGIKVRSGLLEAQARELNPGFIKRMESGLPWVRIKTAISVDGRTAMASGESKWVTGAAARSDVQRYRARSSAMLTGIGTVLHDDASLNVRESELGLDEKLTKLALEKQPIRVVLDRQARLRSNAKILNDTAPVIWCVAKSRLKEYVDPDRQTDDFQRIHNLSHVEVFELDDELSETEQLTNVMALLAEKGCNEVMVEAGAEIVGSAIDAKLFDELIVYMAPKLMGSSARSLAMLPIENMSEAHDLKLKDLRMVGDDIRMVYFRNG